MGQGELLDIDVIVSAASKALCLLCLPALMVILTPIISSSNTPSLSRTLQLVKYGTSVPLARAMNPAYDILIAYEANGEKLQPDHGYPVRLIIPGYIGGRMIKWLTTINVIEHETKNHYHYHDNRILPPHITAEESLTGGWWYKPEYIFNELNINSAMTAPDHNETIDLAANIAGTYNVGGYAYTGGGRRITRVEITTDGGKHWEVCKINQIEKPTDYGMYWCWVWWNYDLKVADLVGCKEIWCRAWDEVRRVLFCVYASHHVNIIACLPLSNTNLY